MNKKTHFKPKQFAIFHDYDNVSINAKHEGKSIIDMILSYINTNGYISSYNIVVSNPNYVQEVTELKNMIALSTRAWLSRIDINEDLTDNDGIGDVDHKLIKAIFQHEKDHPRTDAYILVSGDGDFYPVILFLNVMNKPIKVFSNPNGTNKLLKDYS